MKKFLLLILVVGMNYMHALTPAEKIAQKKAKIKGLVALIEQNPSKAAKYCPTLCTQLGALQAPETACGLCYKTCFPKADRRRRNVKAQAWLAQCTKSKYPAKCCDQVGRKCLSKNVQINQLQSSMKDQTTEIAKLKTTIESDKAIREIYKQRTKFLTRAKKDLTQKVSQQKEIIDVFKKVLDRVQLNAFCQDLLDSLINPGNGLQEVAQQSSSYLSRILARGLTTVTQSAKEAIARRVRIVEGIKTELNNAMGLPNLDRLCKNSLKLIFKDINRIEHAIKNKMQPLFHTVGSELNMQELTRWTAKLKKYVGDLEARVANMVEIGLLDQTRFGAPAEDEEQGPEIVEYPEGGTVVVGGHSTVIPAGGTVIANPANNSVIITTPQGSVRTSRRVTRAQMGTLLRQLVEQGE